MQPQVTRQLLAAPGGTFKGRKTGSTSKIKCTCKFVSCLTTYLYFYAYVKENYRRRDRSCLLFLQLERKTKHQRDAHFGALNLSFISLVANAVCALLLWYGRGVERRDTRRSALFCTDYTVVSCSTTQLL